MTSIRKQVFEFLNIHPDIPLKKLKKEFKDCPNNTIRTYYNQFRDISNNISHISPQEVLKEIYLDKKQPGSTRVQAIREYRTSIDTEDNGEDPLLKLYNKILEKRSLKNQK